MSKRSIPVAIFVCLVLVSLGTIAGCQKGPRRAAVSGMVLVDKVPLMEGSISFQPTEGNEGPETGATIVDGKYTVSRADGAVIGKNKVVIRGFRNTGKKIPDIMDRTKLIDERVKALGEEYNDKSTLVREIVDGKNELNFDLPSLKQGQ